MKFRQTLYGVLAVYDLITVARALRPLRKANVFAGDLLLAL